MPDEELNESNPEENGPAPDNPADENSSEEKTPDPESTDDSTADNIKEPSMESPASDSPEDVKTSEASEPSSEDTKTEASKDDSGDLSQDEIDAAFNSVNGAPSEEKSSSGDAAIELSQDELETALNGEASAPESRPEPDNAGLQQSADDNINIVKPKKFEDFSGIEKSGEEQNIDILLDVTLPVAIELGRTSMPIQDILNLGPGSVVELNRLAGEPVDLLVNDKLIARGEVVVVDENFGVRITSMVSPEERLKGLV